MQVKRNDGMLVQVLLQVLGALNLEPQQSLCHGASHKPDDWAIGAVPIKPAPTGAKIATLNHNAGEFAVGYPHQRKVLRDASGYWYVAYMDYNGSTSKYEIYLTKSTNTAGTSWATPVKIAGQNGIVYNESTYDFRYPSIEINAARDRDPPCLQQGSDRRLGHGRPCRLLPMCDTCQLERERRLDEREWGYLSTIRRRGHDVVGVIHDPTMHRRSASTAPARSTCCSCTARERPTLSTTPHTRVVPGTRLHSPQAQTRRPTRRSRSARNNWLYCAWSLYSATYGLFSRVNFTYYNTGDASPVWSAVTYLILQNDAGVDLRYVSMAADDEGNIQVALRAGQRHRHLPTWLRVGRLFQRHGLDHVRERGANRHAAAGINPRWG